MMVLEVWTRKSPTKSFLLIKCLLIIGYALFWDLSSRSKLIEVSAVQPNIANFGRSLLGGYCSSYVPDFVLQGIGNDERLRQCLISDLSHAVQVSYLHCSWIYLEWTLLTDRTSLPYIFGYTSLCNTIIVLLICYFCTCVFVPVTMRASREFQESTQIEIWNTESIGCIHRCSSSDQLRYQENYICLNVNVIIFSFSDCSLLIYTIDFCILILHFFYLAELSLHFF